MPVTLARNWRKQLDPDSTQLVATTEYIRTIVARGLADLPLGAQGGAYRYWDATWTAAHPRAPQTPAIIVSNPGLAQRTREEMDRVLGKDWDKR